jgi:hypothetical protein
MWPVVQTQVLSKNAATCGAFTSRPANVARSLACTEAFEQSRRERKRIEMRFAHLKRILRLGRLRLRGPRGARDEFTLAAIAQNLRRMAKLIMPIPATQA